MDTMLLDAPNKRNIHVGPLFRIPLWERFTECGNPGSIMFGQFFTWRAGRLADGSLRRTGLVVRYSTQKPPTRRELRRYLTGKRETHCIVEADTPEDAVKQFLDEWEGAKIGDPQDRTLRALWINRKKPILELPPCELLNRNQQGEFICGEELEDGQGEGGGTVLDQYDDEECPMYKFLHLGQGQIPRRRIRVRGTTYQLASWRRAGVSFLR